MYTKYGKSCKSKKSSKSKTPEQEENEAAKDAEQVDDTSASADDAMGQDEAVDGNAEGYAGEDGEGAESYDEYSGEESKEGSMDEFANEGQTDEDESMGGEDGSSESEFVPEEEEKKSSSFHKVMEYDIKEMYPEMNVLVMKKKREWDYQDPDIIRALWLESKTHVLAEWKVRNAKIKSSKSSIEVRDTVTVTLRQEHRKNKAELKKALEEHEFEMTEISREAPHFDSIQLATNLTTEMRYKYNRNNPPVPSHYVEHFEKFKKPPFKNIPNTLSCKL